MKVLFKWAVVLFTMPIMIYLLIGYIIDDFNLFQWSSSGILGIAFLSFAWIIFAFLAYMLEELKRMEEQS